MRRLSAAGLVDLAARLSERDRAITELVGRLRLVSGRQIERLFFTTSTPETNARLARRTLQRLADHRVLGRLERRVGGVRAGSAGWIFTLDVAGQRLIDYWHGNGIGRTRMIHQPETPFTRHTLAVTEQYVVLHEADRTGVLDLLAFEAEPECWRTFPAGMGATLTLKPDAFAVLGVGDFEERAFIEVDCGTEGRGTLRRKCETYVAYQATGIEQTRHGVFPRVVWVTTTERRRALLTDVCASLPADTWQVFTVTTTEQALTALSGEPVGGAS